MREAIYTPQIYKELKKVLSQEEILSLKQTLTSAYYTPKEIVKFMYNFIENLGFVGGDILEPAVGNGVFVEYMPTAIRKLSCVTGVEIDKITSNICKKLYADVEIYNCGFERFNPNQKYDLIIGNLPYGAQKIYDSNHADLRCYRIHHYFVAKSMRLLKQNGILAMVLPSYFLDNVDLHVRHIISREGGEIIAAYRLPDNLFQNAKVTVDIVFLRKGKTANEEKWAKTCHVRVNNHEMPLNEYYHNHRQNIIGELAVTDIRGKMGLTCKNSGVDVFEMLQGFIKQHQNVKYKMELSELKKQFQILNNELKKINQAFATTNQAIAGIYRKITELEEKLKSG